MTKADLMAHWDEVVTDRRLTLDRANAHLARVHEDGPSYLLGEYTVIASGGSTGQRGVFVWDFEGWLAYWLNTASFQEWVRCRFPAPAGDRVASVMAAHATHAGAAFAATFAVPGTPRVSLPASLPIDEIVAGLNAFQPTELIGYPSLLSRLALEAQAGGLRVAPVRLLASAEPLYPEARRVIEAAFGAPLTNLYGTSETGPMGNSLPGSAGLHLVEDAAVYEPVDQHGQPVAPGRRAAKLLVTNVINRALPLFRYELTDEVTFLAEPNPGPWTGRRIAEPQGRLDDLFWYDHDRAVHSHVFRTALSAASAVTEYQVRQTPRGADIAVLATGDYDPAAIRRELVAVFAQLGIPDAEIRLHTVAALDRQPGSGKLKRFVPLAR